MLKVMIDDQVRTGEGRTVCFMLAKNFTDDDMILSFIERFGEHASKGARLHDFSYSAPSWPIIEVLLPRTIGKIVDEIAHDMPAAPYGFCYAASIYYDYN